MIKLSKNNKKEFYLNPTLIETIEKTPDTVITLINNKKYIVSESGEEIVRMIAEYYKSVNMIPPQIAFNEYDFSEKSK